MCDVTELTVFQTGYTHSKYPIFVHTVAFPTTRKERCLEKRQEGQRKDVERAFGFLKANSHLLEQPARFWSVKRMRLVIRACIVLHNMTVEERVKIDEELEEFYGMGLRGFTSNEIFKNNCRSMWASFTSDAPSTITPPGTLEAFCEMSHYLENEREYCVLHHLVMDHLWSREGDI